MTTLVDYDIDFLGKSWNWLNDPEIRKLTLTPVFSKEEQLIYFKQLPTRKDYWIKGVMHDDTAIGATGLKNINADEGSAEFWGYIGEKAYWGKGIGKYMLNEVIKKAKRLNLTHIYLYVAKYNDRAKALYKKTGFELIEESPETEKYILQL